MLTLEGLHWSNICLESPVCTRIIAFLLQPKWEEVSQQASACSLPGRCTWSRHIRFPFRQNQFTAPTKKQEAERNSVWLQVDWSWSLLGFTYVLQVVVHCEASKMKDFVYKICQCPIKSRKFYYCFVYFELLFIPRNC